MIFGEIESFVSLVERVIKPFNKGDKTHQELLSTRLVSVFEAHGVHRNQIPNVIGHGLTLHDVSSDERLLEKLNNEILASTCNLFGINRDWLDGSSEEVYPTYNFYKYPQKFSNFLSGLVTKCGCENLDGVLLTVDKVDRGTESVLILQETLGHINNKPYFRYYLCSGWVFSYWKSRGYIAASVAMCWKNQVYVRGLYLDASTVSRYASGESLLNFGQDGIHFPNGVRWYAEDLAEDPEMYLKNVDPEENKNGLDAALSLWFQLNNQGFLDTGYSDGTVLKKFSDAREKLA
ncbi:hypothetical protein [Vibrio parahaemolyticus]|uniref:hypothetical protein n=1 Tax=Vibrio parahaemolyticus TaxID=670 RepID=UPI001121B669|nr:hypothetical protein [Vibrio parahaemolyticus]EJG0707133.1 hypothetical protein [Vibrio parahaemolyticus]TOK68217.1 hypothetical protein CGI13_22630 [Vibrio parahaemolyticus]HCE2379845.1 hypothetical protein [Vibrio parahaemolyticus]HCE2588765.1 hypothetical protein [Vibrio parahaemolyticus]HCG8728478.1 hypothetical protein [Vibrio parahaemolyticus]